MNDAMQILFFTKNVFISSSPWIPLFGNAREIEEVTIIQRPPLKFSAFFFPSSNGKTLSKLGLKAMEFIEQWKHDGILEQWKLLNGFQTAFVFLKKLERLDFKCRSVNLKVQIDSLISLFIHPSIYLSVYMHINLFKYIFGFILAQMLYPFSRGNTRLLSAKSSHCNSFYGRIWET